MSGCALKVEGDAFLSLRLFHLNYTTVEIHLWSLTCMGKRNFCDANLFTFCNITCI